MILKINIKYQHNYIYIHIIYREYIIQESLSIGLYWYKIRPHKTNQLQGTLTREPKDTQSTGTTHP